MSFNRRGDDDRNYGGRQDESSRGGNDGYRGDRGGSSYRNDDRGGPGGYGGGRGEGRRDPSPRGRMIGDDRQRGGDDDRRQISRGGRSPTGRSPPPARRSGDYGAPPSGRSGYDGGRGGGGGGAYGREDRGERSARPADSSFSRDDRDRRGDDRAVDRGRGNYGNDARAPAPRDDNRGGGFEDRSGDRDGRGPAGGRGGFSSDAGRDNGRDGAARGGGFDNGARGGGYGGTDRDRGGDRDRDGGRGGYAGDRGGDRDGGSRGGFGGDRGDRDGGARGGYGGGERRDRDEGGFSSRGAREGGGGGFSRGARNGAFDERSDNRDSRDQGFDSQRNDNDGGFSGGRGGGGFGRGRGAYEGSGGRGGGGGFGGDRGGSGFGGDRNGGGGRDEGEFGNRNGYNNDRNEGGGFGGGGRGSFDGGRGGFSGRGGRGGFGGDRGGSGFGGDRNGGGFGEDRNGGGFSSGGGGGGFSSAGNDNGFSSFGRNGGGFGQDRAERNYDETAFDGSRRYAGRGYQTQMREADELYASDARNAQNQVLDADVKVKFEGQDADAIHEIVSWAKSGLDRDLIDVCENRCKYTTVRPIQAAGIPIIMAGRDVLAQSETGSGKSAAFMLPVVNELIKMDDVGPNKVYAIMVAPTKELVIQLNEQAIRFTKPLPGIKVVCSIGQSGYSNTIGALSCGAHILIATIGRLKDHIEKGHILLDSLRFFVLDEADRMLEDKKGTREMDMVFYNPKWHKEQIQHLLFSATLPNEVKAYARKLVKPNYITITPVEETLANKKIKQIFHRADNIAEKNALLTKLIMEEKRRCDEDGTEFRKTLIFVNRKTTTNVLAMFFSSTIKGVKAQSLHGDKGQDLRDEAIRQFRSGELKILIGTDVCERGLDIEGLEHVINYDMPTEGDRYTHRIGRTGRVHNGTATSFIESGDARILPPIVRIAKAAKQEVPDWLDDLAGGAGGDDGGFGNGGGFGRGGGGGGFGSGGGGGFGASEGFGDSGGFGSAGGFESAAGGGFDNSSSGFGAAAADEWGTATATTEEKKKEEGEEENPFDTGRVREALEETTQDDRTPPPSAPKPTVSALPSEFQTQNNVPDDEEW